VLFFLFLAYLFVNLAVVLLHLPENFVNGMSFHVGGGGWSMGKRQGPAQDCWSAYFFSIKFIISWSKSILFLIFHNFMVKINTFFSEWWSGPTSADRQGQNTETVHWSNAHEASWSEVSRFEWTFRDS
jgi:hypothetical protein